MARKKVVRKQARRQRVPRPVKLRAPQGFLNVKRTFGVGNLSTVGPITMNFRLIDVPNFKQFDMFDYYRICAVKVTFHPSTRGTDTTVRPDLALARDYNSTGNTITNIADALNRQGARRYQVNTKDFSLYLKPRASQVVNTPSGTTSKPVSKSSWMNMGTSQADIDAGKSHSQIPHFGIVGFYDPYNSGVQVTVWATYYLQFKGIDT